MSCKCKCSCEGDSQNATKSQEVLETVKEYYGKVLKKTSDLKTDACCTAKTRMAKSAKEALAMVHDDVVSRYYGCGLIVPECLEGMKILDLGSGAGQDCYVLSKLVGEQGHVTGVDMTDEQLDVARKYQQYHADKFGFSKPNTDFVKGYIESLGAAGLGDNQFDLIVSNCVVNLSPDKRAVLTEACRVLKEGGEFFFGDVYADRDLPEEIRKHKVLWGECIAGSLWWKDLYKIAEQVGFSRPRLFAASKIGVKNAELEAVLGDSKFVSVTYRLFKLPQTKEPVTEVVYNGGITDFDDSFRLDHEWTFKKGETQVVSGEVASIIKKSRFACKFTLAATDKQPTKEEVVMVDPFEYVTRDTTDNGSKCCPEDKGQSSKCCTTNVKGKCC